ncbi:MAG TPA: hypothetical protein VJS92_01950 [Candidatus Polarisedimenticolaceae bacterium]|nr:hypothetical protein [Candidatus Polarisedimenticolaceae bacterium]
MGETPAGGGKRGCFRLGCYGCLGVLALIVIGAAVLVGLNLMVGRREPKQERRELSRQVPKAAPPSSPAGVAPSTLESPELRSASRGRLVLDVSIGTFSIVAGPEGQPIRVEGEYDTAAYELTDNYTEGPAGWTDEVMFRRKGGWLLHMFDHEARNHVRIVVPRGVPFALEGSIGTGESRLELGGLWIVRTDLKLGVGEHRVSFSEPAPLPQEEFLLDASIGELGVRQLGNASPRTVKIGHRIGDVELDLSGGWSRDAQIQAECGIGECRLHVPEDVGLEVTDSALMLGEHRTPTRSRAPGRPGGPTLHLSVKGQVGELSVD